MKTRSNKREVIIRRRVKTVKKVVNIMEIDAAARGRRGRGQRTGRLALVGLVEVGQGRKIMDLALALKEFHVHFASSVKHIH
jgi:ribosomal protein L13E